MINAGQNRAVEAVRVVDLAGLENAVTGAAVHAVLHADLAVAAHQPIRGSGRAARASEPVPARLSVALGIQAIHEAIAVFVARARASAFGRRERATHRTGG